MPNRYFTLADLFDLINGREKAEPVERKETVEPTPSNLGSIYSTASLDDAIKQYEAEMNDEEAEHNRKMAEKRAKIEALRKRMELEAKKTKMVRQGSNIAITMTKENAQALMENLINAMSKNDSELVTFTISNVD